ncbi:MAG: 50S ribosomal protein L23 [Candidatus Omnitrophica bacterium CG11_big_fil_rev_8_21_14_0_20_41_12]|nr:MAG: 50S ribosomal protein L23 [Candidatus Omnitrophica bacterium CG11_big_fil_rev_8_21_14_0_20_41_12]
MAHTDVIIKALLHTEKSSTYAGIAKYLFLVDNFANKIQIKKAVELLYKVKVKNVNTFVAIGKLKKVRHQLGRTSDTKKAVVTLAAGQKIEVA